MDWRASAGGLLFETGVAEAPARGWSAAELADLARERAAIYHSCEVAGGGGVDGEGVTCAAVRTKLGVFFAAATGRGVCMFEFVRRRAMPEQLKSLKRWFGGEARVGESELIERLRREIDEYAAGERREFATPMDLRGTAFQVRVWEELLRIPYGETRSYEQVAEAVGGKAAVRAVGRANGENRVPVVVPCHRVVLKSGGLCGYGGGVELKRRLLELEARLTAGGGE